MPVLDEALTRTKSDPLQPTMTLHVSCRMPFASELHDADGSVNDLSTHKCRCEPHIQCMWLTAPMMCRGQRCSLRARTASSGGASSRVRAVRRTQRRRHVRDRVQARQARRAPAAGRRSADGPSRRRRCSCVVWHCTRASRCNKAQWFGRSRLLHDINHACLPMQHQDT